MSTREELLELYSRDRIYAHKVLFAHRHKEESPEFHTHLLNAFYSDNPLVVAEAFRGSAKSTLLEEVTCLKALFQEIRFGLFLGNSFTNACSRLASVKDELTNNDALIELFGDQHGSVWSEGEIVLANGIKLQALGARQSMRGVKHNDERPDFGAIDDLEDEEMVATPQAIIKNRRWLNGTLLPAFNPKTRQIRWVGTPLDPNCLIEQKMTDKAWVSLRFPALYIDGDGAERSTWEERFSTEHLHKIKQSYIDEGSLTEFEQEYMCRAESAAMKPFKPEVIPTPQAIPATWMAKTLVVDPARKGQARPDQQRKLSRTGYSVHGWLGNKLVVFEGFGSFDDPTKIIDTLFKLDDEYEFMEIAIEKDGLEEFLMQPIRNEMLKRGRALPIVPVMAPKNKDVFITGLQNFYVANDVIHTKQMPDLVGELLQFPSGRKDVPNALAYALKLRSGQPIYEDFRDMHVNETLDLEPSRPVYLAISARETMTAAVMLQYLDGAVRVVKDWLKNLPPLECLQDIVAEAAVHAGRKLIMTAPLEQHETYTNYGLPAAARQNRFEILPTVKAKDCLGTLRDFLRKTVRGEPGFMVDMGARWVLNGMAGGYGRKLTKAGVIQDKPAENEYQIVCEAIEAFVVWVSTMQEVRDNDPNRRYDTTPDGRTFLTTLPQRRPHGR